MASPVASPAASPAAKPSASVQSLPPLNNPVTVRMGWLKLGHLVPMYLMPELAKKYNISIETTEFGRYADARTALASGELDITAYGPQDTALALSQGVTTLQMVAGVANGGDCLVARKGANIQTWSDLKDKNIGIGAGSISWLKFVASVEENGVDYKSLKITNIAGAGGNYLQALQRGEIDLAVLWDPFCSQGVLGGYAEYPGIDHNHSKAVGGLNGVIAVNKTWAEKNRDVVDRLVAAYVEAQEQLKGDRELYVRKYMEFTGLDEPTVREAVKHVEFTYLLPQDTIERITSYLYTTGVITKDVTAEIKDYMTWDPLAKATGKSPRELGKKE